MFYQCYGLQSVNIPSSVKKISDYAFYNCYGLQSVNIPSSVTSIGINAFYLCCGLQSVNIPSSVTSIAAASFNGCYGLICSYYGAYKNTSVSDFYLINSQNTNHNTIYYRNIYNR